MPAVLPVIDKNIYPADSTFVLLGEHNFFMLPIQIEKLIVLQEFSRSSVPDT